jgi:hypothetical protein
MNEAIVSAIVDLIEAVVADKQPNADSGDAIYLRECKDRLADLLNTMEHRR